LRLQVTEGTETRFITSDAQGRYEVFVSGMTKLEPSPETGYLAPCPAGGLPGFFDTTAHVAHRGVLSTTGTPGTMPRTGLYASGRVVGPAPSRDPVSGAQVELDNYGWILSSTVSDAQGRYLLCTFPAGAGTDQAGLVRATKPGHRPVVLEVFFLGPVAVPDLELALE
jgi:hypothetical protein